MFLLFEVVSENLILGMIPESLEVLIFGIGLVVLAIVLRAVFKRIEKNADGDMINRTK